MELPKVCQFNWPLLKKLGHVLKSWSNVVFMYQMLLINVDMIQFHENCILISHDIACHGWLVNKSMTPWVAKM